MPTKWVFASVAVAALALYTGCPGSLEDKDSFLVDGGGGTDTPGTSCDDAMPIFAASCLESGCHNKTDKYSDLDLETPGVVARYKGVKTKGGGGMHNLIDESAPEKSAIYTKTKTPPPYGLKMPVTGSALSDDKTACILSWIKKELASGGGGTDSGTTEETGGETGGEMDAGSD